MQFPELYIHVFICVWTEQHLHTHHSTCEGQRTTQGNHLSPSSTWVPMIECEFSDLKSFIEPYFSLNIFLMCKRKDRRPPWYQQTKDYMISSSPLRCTVPNILGFMVWVHWAYFWNELEFDGLTVFHSDTNKN